MNFKTILTLSALSFIGSIKAAPVNSNNCRGIPLSLNSDSKIACIVPSEGNESLRYNTHCAEVTPFGSTETKIYCIDEVATTVNSCKVSSSNYNYDQCMKLLYFAGKNEKLNIDVHNESLVKAQHDCRQKKGIELTLDGKKFACVQPVAEELNDKICVSIEGYRTPYCIKGHDTNIKACDLSSDEFNLNYCLRFLSSAGRINHLSIDLLTNPTKLNYNKVEKIESVEESCKAKNGIYLSFDNTKYVCVIPVSQFSSQFANEGNNDGKSHCVTLKKYNYDDKEPSKKSVYCVDEKFTNNNNCNVHSELYNYNSCMQYVVSVGRSNQYSIDVYSDEQECIDHQGIYLTFDNKKYVCVVPTGNEERENKHCVSLNKYTYEEKPSKKRAYCIREKNTNVSNCNIHSENYNYNTCMQYVVSVGRSSQYKIDVL